MKALAVLCLAGCASFEDPTTVIDLRVLAIETEPPEQVLDIDPRTPPMIDNVLAQLAPIRVRALVAEPGVPDPVVWSLTACLLDEQGTRCLADKPAFEIASGLLRDPETAREGSACEGGAAEGGGTLCAMLVPDNRLVQLMLAALADDPAHGLGGIDIGIQLRVLGAAEVFAAKRMRFSPRIPLDRRPNHNPHIDRWVVGTGGMGGINIRVESCAVPSDKAYNYVDSGDVFTLFPFALEGDQEDYVLPTLDGGSETFKEYLTYQWVATAGTFADEITGGPPDPFGNVTADGSAWHAPTVSVPTPVTVWVVQRDGRGGVRWRQGCIMVDP